VNSKYLTKAEISDLDDEIDRRIASFKLLRRPKAAAIFHLLISFETRMERSGEFMHLPERGLAYEKAYNGLNYALRWIHELCIDIHWQRCIDFEILEESDELLTEAGVYSQFWTQMVLLHKGRNRAQRLNKHEIIISAIEPGNRDLDTAGAVLADAQYPVNPKDTQSLSEEIFEQIRRKVKISQNSQAGFQYSFDQKLFNSVRRTRSQRNLIRRTMSPDWDLGDYTYKQLRTFWATLDALNEIHSVSVGRINNVGRKRTYQVRALTKQGWIDRISRWSKLEKSIVEKIIDDLTYSKAIHANKARNKRAHVMYQPFIPLENDSIALSTSIVRISNYERNMWTLISILRPAVFSKLSDASKECFWIQSFIKKKALKNAICIPRIKYTHKRIKRDLDLLIVDRDLRFVLICQLKWLTRAPGPQSVFDDDLDLRTATEQAKDALEWAELNHDRLSEVTGLAIEDIKHFEFRPIVISKDTLPSGNFGETVVPVIDERLFDWITDSPHYRSLRELWSAADSLSYVPREGVHFVNSDREIGWGNLRFILRGLAFNISNRWTPEDIRF